MGRRGRSGGWRVKAMLVAVTLGPSAGRAAPAAPPGPEVVAAAIAAAPHAPTRPGARDAATRTPIRRLVVIVGQDGRSFDHLFGLYRPAEGQTVTNLLSEGVLDTRGRPGPAFARAAQRRATDTDRFRLAPALGAPFAHLPATPMAFAPGFAPPAGVVAEGVGPAPGDVFATGRQAARAWSLANGPFVLPPGLAHDDQARRPTHRFYQMFQQLDCRADRARAASPSGCRGDLFAWVETTAGDGGDGNTPSADQGPAQAREGAIALGVQDIDAGVAPVLRRLARDYTLLDNYHQAAKGGVAVNSLYFAFADALWFSDGLGHAARPPAEQIEDPDPLPHTNNRWRNDGVMSGAYSACADPGQPGVGAVRAYLAALKVAPRCERGLWYMLNDLEPRYFGAGQRAYPGPGAEASLSVGPFSLPPSPVASIGDVLDAHQVSWAYYGANWDLYLAHPGDEAARRLYCARCNPFLFETAIMTGADLASGAPLSVLHLKDTVDLFQDIRGRTLPAVAFVTPGALDPAYPDALSITAFDAFVGAVTEAIEADPVLARDTAILITFADSGGYYDSGPVRTLDFFGDGVRVPAILVSRFSRGGRVSHLYADHASVAKFVEANWGLPTISARARDGLPNPVRSGAAPSPPADPGPAISDLMDAFDFGAASSR